MLCAGSSGCGTGWWMQAWVVTQQGSPFLLSLAQIILSSSAVYPHDVCREQQVWDWLVDAGMSGDASGILLSSLQVSLSVLLLLSLLSLAQIIFARVKNPTKPPFSSSFSESFPLPASPFTSSPYGRRKQVETKEELQQLLMNLDGKLAAAAAAAFAAGGSADGEGMGGGAGADGGDGRGIVGGRGRAAEGAAAAARGGGEGGAGDRGGDNSASYPTGYYQFQPEYFDRLPPISPRTLADSLIPTTPNIPRSSSLGASASPLPPSSFSPASPLRSSSPPPFSTPSHRHTHTDATAPFLTTPQRYILPSSLSTPPPSTGHPDLYNPSFTFPRSSLPFDTVTLDNAPSSPLLVHPRLTPSPSRAAIVGKKGEVERLKPMLPEEEEEGFKRLGVLQWRDTWRDGIRQWFSQHLLKALVKKIEAAPSKLSAAAAPLGLSLSLEPLHSLGNSAVPPPAGSAGLAQTSTPGSAGVTAGGSSGLGVGGLGGVEGGGVEEVGGGGRVVVVQGSVMGEREGLQQVKGVLLQLLQSANQAGVIVTGVITVASVFVEACVTVGAGVIGGGGRGESGGGAGECDGGEGGIAASEGGAATAAAVGQSSAGSMLIFEAPQRSQVLGPAPPAGSIFGLHQPQQQQQQQQLEAQKEAARNLLAAIADYEHLRDVLRGHWAKGLLPRGSMPLEYSTQRIKALAAGSCLRCFQWSAGGSFLTRDTTRTPTTSSSPAAAIPSSTTASATPTHHSLHSSFPPEALSPAPSSPAPSSPSSFSPSQPSSVSYSLQAAPEGVFLVPWTSDLPTDAHLLAYLFAAHLSHPHWLDDYLQSPLPQQQQQQQVSAAAATMPATAASFAAQNPLVVGGSLPRDILVPLSSSSSSQSPSALLGGRFTAIVGSIPPANVRVPPGADVLVITRDAPPVFVLFWECQPSFCLQGRFALWDAVLLLCLGVHLHQGGVIGDVSLSSPSLALSTVMVPVIPPISS
ncbi:unnamed protein product [Closterium sp. NIES-65]|nr:unnamed protein product [Closterium sp. NIES-65]